MSILNLKVKVLVAQLCPTLCNPMNCGLPGSSVHGILQARILEWVAISFPRGSSLPRDLTRNKLVNILWIMKEVTGKERRKARMNPVGSKLTWICGVWCRWTDTAIEMYVWVNLHRLSACIDRKGLDFPQATMNTLGTQNMISWYHSPIKQTKVSGRNGWFWGWSKKTTTFCTKM